MAHKYNPKKIIWNRRAKRLEGRLKSKWIWGDDKNGYCVLRRWPEGETEPVKIKPEYIFPRGDRVWIKQEKDSYSLVANLRRGQTGWVNTDDLMDQHPLETLSWELGDYYLDQDRELVMEPKFLFELTPYNTYQQHLTSGPVKKELSDAFKAKNHNLSNTAKLKKIKEKSWNIIDGSKTYLIIDASSKIKVHDPTKEEPKRGAPDTKLEKKLDSKVCASGACEIQNWLRKAGIKHVPVTGSAKGIKVSKTISYYYDNAGNRHTNVNKIKDFLWPGDLIVFGNVDNLDIGNTTLHLSVTNNPNNTKFQYIGWSGHIATMSKFHLKTDGEIEKLDLIEAHQSTSSKTEGKTYEIENIYYWGIVNWGFKRTKDRVNYDNAWDDWWAYQYVEGKKYNDNSLIARAKTLLENECKNRKVPVITPEKAWDRVEDKKSTACSWLDIYGLAYWIEPKSA